jgi:hypothetical protein
MPSPSSTLPVYNTSKWLEDFFMLLYRSVSVFLLYHEVLFVLMLSSVEVNQRVGTNRVFEKLLAASEFSSRTPLCSSTQSHGLLYNSTSLQVTLCSCINVPEFGGQAMSTMVCTGWAAST